MKKRPARPVDQTEWLSPEEVAKLLGETHWTVLRWAKNGDSRLMAYKVWDASSGNQDQGKFRFRKEDVDAFARSYLGTTEGRRPPVAGDAAPIVPGGSDDPIEES